MPKMKLTASKRLVVKIGSALLVDESSGHIHQQWLASLIEDIAQYASHDQQVIIVSSGSINLGRGSLGFNRLPLKLEEKQAAAAAGQIRLAHIYQTMLAKHQLCAAQILLTLSDSEDRKRYINAKNTLETLLKAKAIPIINENDTIATTEIRFGDNDRLAARIAQMSEADTLVLLSDIDGLYDSDPRKNAQARFIPEVKEITTDILNMAGDTSTTVGSGGMITKLKAAQIAMGSGCRMVIANGKAQHPLSNIDKGERCTWFIPALSRHKARKNWIRHHLQPQGKIIINDGAVTALQNGKSLLAAGATAIEGHFQKGEVVCVCTQSSMEIARGLCNYSADESQKILGKKSDEIEAALGYFASSELIHRNNLVLLN
ncbi:MAG: glutamate 5-kinase [Gammaproteobacteria bacterium]